MIVLAVAVGSWQSSRAQPVETREPSQATQKNSTRKQRVEPSPIAARAGSAINWREDLATALAQSADTGKPVFWYVPTVQGTFMDRQVEIDRYMMAGPFSWPRIISLINERFIPVKAPATEDEQRTYDLAVFRFVEPGFVIISPGGKVTMQVDRLTTLHIDWLERLVRTAAGDAESTPSASDPARVALGEAWRAFREGRYEIDTTPLAAIERDDELAVESLLLAGMFEFRRGQQAAAGELWRAAAAAGSEHPLGWKAAAEAEGFGPFVRGFEVHSDLPEAAWRAGIDSAGSAAPPETYDEPELWSRGVDFLLGMQDESGVWRDTDYDFGGADSLTNVQVAVTALAAMALDEADSRLDAADPRRQRIADAIARAEAYALDDSHINRADSDELLWALVYRVHLLARKIAKSQRAASEPVDQQLAERLAAAVSDVENLQLRTGSWYHEYANPFVTATALVALHDARLAGAAIHTPKVDGGLRALARSRSPVGGFTYGTPRGSGDGPYVDREEPIAASAGRMPTCELARRLWGASDDAALATALQAAFEHHATLASALKYDNHTANFAYGGFFFWFDMYGRSRAIRHLPPGAVRAAMIDQQRQLILALPEIDGAFVDSHELGRTYGTAMALLSLAELARVD